MIKLLSALLFCLALATPAFAGQPVDINSADAATLAASLDGVGPAKAKEMMFTSRTYSGAQAEAMGLANICFADDMFETQVDKLTKEILGNSWFSHRANKKLVDDTEGLSLTAGLAHEIYRSEGRGPDSQERIAAFMKK